MGLGQRWSFDFGRLVFNHFKFSFEPLNTFADFPVYFILDQFDPLNFHCRDDIYLSELIDDLFNGSLLHSTDPQHPKKSFSKLQDANPIKDILSDQVTQKTPEIFQVNLKPLQKYPLDQNIRVIDQQSKYDVEVKGFEFVLKLKKLSLDLNQDYVEGNLSLPVVVRRRREQKWHVWFLQQDWCRGKHCIGLLHWLLNFEDYLFLLVTGVFMKHQVLKQFHQYFGLLEEVSRT